VLSAASPKLAEECGEDGYVRSGGRLASQIGVDHPPARIDRDDVAEVVRRVSTVQAVSPEGLSWSWPSRAMVSFPYGAHRIEGSF
jgi:hypothetical protein